MACAIAWRYDRCGGQNPKVHANDEDGWRGELRLDYERRAERTVLAARQHAGPILVQKPFYPEGGEVCHGIVLHPPGGLVGGDRLELSARANESAAVLLTTPGATKWYRSAGRDARQLLRFQVGRRASLEWLPQPSIVFNHALGQAETEVSLDASGCYIGWELLCLGRTAAGERFSEGRMLTRMRVLRDGEPLWIERARIQGGSRLLDSPLGLAGEAVSGTLLAASSATSAALLDACRAIRPASGRGGITRLPGILVARFLGEHAAVGHDYFVRLWQLLRPALIGRSGVPPRIWST